MAQKAKLVAVAHEDVLIDVNYLVSSGLFKSQAAVYRAEIAGMIPKAVTIGVTKRWRLAEWRAFLASGKGNARLTRARLDVTKNT
jgi:predicted DNA-binding transcriptional regulator AlpA